MNFKKLLSISTLCLLLIIGHSVAQKNTGNLKRMADKADLLFSQENYWEAVVLYKDLAEAEPTNVKYNNRAGICYFMSPQKTKSIPFFEAAEKNWGNDVIPEVYYYLGTSYQMLNQFDKAITYFNKLKESAKAAGSTSFTESDRAIQQCNYGKKFMEAPTSVRIFNIGSTINSKDPEYAPVISADESKMIFTSKRKEGTGKSTTPDGYYYEDIYIAEKVSEGWNVQVIDSSAQNKKQGLFYVFWSKARKIGNSINTKDHDAAISLSPDGKTLFMYRDNFIYQTKFDGTNWGAPELLSEHVNEKRSFQPSCSMTSDGTLLYIVSDRPGGSGGKDIYVSSMQDNGTWGPCTNLGENINSEYDEDSPFITSDGKTLYFSSQGHTSMGGYDIFKSELVDGVWSKPVNLGYPTNTGADDIFFVMNDDQTRAYLSSIKDDTYGDFDIYVLSFVPETHLYASVKEGGIYTPINTVITTRGSKAPIDTNTYGVCITPGYHKLALLAPDQYNITISAPGYKSHTVDLKIPGQSYKKPFYNEINFETFKSADGKPLKQVTTIYTGFFDVDSVVNANPSWANMPDRQKAYSEMIKSIDPNNTQLNLKIFSFTDMLIDTVALAAAKKKEIELAKEKEREKAREREKETITAIGTTESTTTTSGTTTSATTSGTTPTTGTTGTTSGTTTTATTSGTTPTTGTSSTTTTTSATTSGTTPTTGTTESTSGATTGGTTVARTGTPSSVELRSFDPILFDYSKSILRDEVKPELEDIYKYLKENTSLKLEVTGHTDSKGANQFNLALSIRRATETINYFKSRGIDSKRLKATGKGEAQPVAPNENPDKSDNPSGREQNRRVEFKVTTQVSTKK